MERQLKYRDDEPTCLISRIPGFISISSQSFRPPPRMTRHARKIPGEEDGGWLKRFSAVHDGGIKPRLVTVALEINRALSNVRTVGVNEEVKESHWLLPTPGP
ncbi:hypothetical protein WN51_10792 [Melipona quadrifasciata]|uniref:Uncharacterized protein n=1 Tax=Melipona quadrifasciata TaxID=166423 RepID=A0A0M9A5L5_9HYME|nr:hypothetical protein WN51_10792 [Melipona quadrifasciata]